MHTILYHQDGPLENGGPGYSLNCGGHSINGGGWPMAYSLTSVGKTYAESYILQKKTFVCASI